MGALIGPLFAVAIFALIGFAAAAQSRQLRDLGRLTTSGIPARGLVLRVAAFGMKTAGAGRRFERRSMTLDVEVPGRPPYEVSGVQLVPGSLLRRVLPGATVQLRVDPSNPQKLALVAPGAASLQGLAPLGFAAYQPPMTGSPGAGRVMIPLAVMAVLFGVVAFVATRSGGSSRGHDTKPAVVAPAETTPAVATATSTATAAATSRSAMCAAAADCCKVVGGSATSCGVLLKTTMPADACKKAYDGYRQTATALGKKCR